MNWDEAIYIRKKIEKKLDEDNGYGMPPKAMTACSATAGDGQVELSWSLPSDTIVDNQTLVEVEGVVIIRKLGSAPQNITDGVKVTESKLSIGTFVDTNVENGQTYYYRFIPYSTEGAYSMSPDNVARANPEYIIYGFHDDFTDSNPDTRITYPNDVVNSGYTPMLTNPEMTGTTTTAGSWTTFLSDFLKNKPAMVKSDGELDYWLDPSDYTKKLDGTASDVSNTSYSGAGAFAWIDKFYMKEVYDQDGNGRTVYFCKSKPDNDYYPVGFVDENDNELTGLWIPMFVDNETNEKIIGNTTIRHADSNYTKETLQQKMDRINLLGNRAKPLGGPIIHAIRDLEYMLYKSTYIYSKAGHGFTGASFGGTYDITNFILPNGPVSGFRGATANNPNYNREEFFVKSFHSMVLHLNEYDVIDPYIHIKPGSFASQKIKYSYNYKVDLTGDTYEDVGYLSEFKISDTAGNGYPTRMKHINKKIGSIPDMINGYKQGSHTTGYTDCTENLNYAERYDSIIYRMSYRARGLLYFGLLESDEDAMIVDKTFYPTYRIIPLILPPLNYNPNT